MAIDEGIITIKQAVQMLRGWYKESGKWYYLEIRKQENGYRTTRSFW